MDISLPLEAVAQGSPGCCCLMVRNADVLHLELRRPSSGRQNSISAPWPRKGTGNQGGVPSAADGGLDGGMAAVEDDAGCRDSKDRHEEGEALDVVPVEVGNGKCG